MDDKKQLMRIKSVMERIILEGKAPQDIEIEELKHYLTIEEIAIYFKMLAEYFHEKSNKNNKDTFVLRWEELTPYKILNIEEREYTKEELLRIVGLRIKTLQQIGKKEKIDKILEAYSQIMKTSNKKI